MITRFEETEKNLVLEFSCRSATRGKDGDKEGINNFTTLGGGIRTAYKQGLDPGFRRGRQVFARKKRNGQ